MRNIILVVFLLLLSLSLHADSKTLAKKSIDECGILENYSHIAFCRKKLHEEADKQLNQAYGKLMGYLKNEEDKKRLRNAQRSWIKFRDADCYFAEPREDNLEENWQGNYSIVSANKFSCLAKHTIHRLSELEEYISWTGCNGCPW